MQVFSHFLYLLTFMFIFHVFIFSLKIHHNIYSFKFININIKFMQASIDPLTGGLIFNNPDEEFSQ